MNQGLRIPLAAVGCCLLLAAGGCTRTSDGSVVMKNPPNLSLAVPSFLRFGGQDAEPEAQVAAATFPAAPKPAVQPVGSAPAKVLPPVRAWKATGVKAPFKRADPSAPLTCRNETGGGGRVKVVCQ